MDFGDIYLSLLSGNLGRQYGEAMKFLDEDVRQKQTEKQWREHLRIAWEISPALAVFLPQRMNNSPILQILQKEVTRYVRTYPEEVCHIPRYVPKLSKRLYQFTLLSIYSLFVHFFIQ